MIQFRLIPIILFQTQFYWKQIVSSKHLWKTVNYTVENDVTNLDSTVSCSIPLFSPSDATVAGGNGRLSCSSSKSTSPKQTLSKRKIAEHLSKKCMDNFHSATIFLQSWTIFSTERSVLSII